jgi:hypothetical protein
VVLAHGGAGFLDALMEPLPHGSLTVLVSLRSSNLCADFSRREVWLENRDLESEL